MASGDTKTEAMLNVLGNGGSGDEFRGCCNTKTQSYILDAIDRINSLTPGGSSDFNDLSNRPQLNGAQMTGSTNITNFTGTDGNTAGAQGLVPAPATTDAGKFLKADGTWDTAGGGGPTVVQTLGSSTTDVMSQDAATKLIYPNYSSFPTVIEIGTSAMISAWTHLAIGNGSQAAAWATALGSGDANLSGAKARNQYSIAIGSGADVESDEGIAIGSATVPANARGSIAIGDSSGGNINAKGMVDFGTSSTSNGYNSTNYRLITGIHDGQNAHDVATVGQINATIDAINLALNTNIPHVGAQS